MLDFEKDQDNFKNINIDYNLVYIYNKWYLDPMFLIDKMLFISFHLIF